MVMNQDISKRTAPDPERAHASRTVRLVSGTISLLAITLGLLAHTFREALGMSPDVARSVAGGLALTSCLYAAVLFWWDRLALRR